ncbi:alpha-1,2-fucosyltransferase [Aliarcobacter cryaerophilus ATCC 43158]|uniref:Alpha-1,2-fucosyltransferase n=2 Tax=Aliarcobacter cryaerophilus TaxID=28198 RepID=A0AAD0TT76_9BACT|nr:alpha-1,2-fucosyltransferase [Aliarcobacter cryaerophilus]AYJ79911.1 alpha-1,2-fucosyltransferase [Aliarcobacter cryaerophilus ATCC 43158]PRM96873.1 alpha-1,2-fucosyltransferase [Aliarcobacter cryaerophilus]QCZ24143.1 alpha-1,2-fucosyltransferase [Aliarcobacter cryaerophilus ATCC 43158]
MIIVKIIGGLGNQMFEYAYAKALQQKGYEVNIDISEFDTYKLHGGFQLDKYDIDLQISSTQENDTFYKRNIFFSILNKLNLLPRKIIKERDISFCKELLEIKDNSYVMGYFQCEKYFIDIKKVLIEQFKINQPISSFTFEIEEKILKFKNSCSLHIRRGDYTHKSNANIHGVCSLDYYKNAIEVMKNQLGNDIVYFIFSDDIEWVKNNLIIENAIYIDSQETRLPHEDIYLMSLCNHNIIANSSFSWWGAWLNQNQKKIVIAPKKWFENTKMQKQVKDIIPDTWIKI